MSKVWLITDANSGFGRAFAEAAIAALASDETSLRPALGDDPIDAIHAHLDQVRADLDAWDEVGRGTKLS
ncbi:MULTISPECIES: hypothetical protein [Streptomyces]|uniref:Short-chain dehydrogenase n=1 Tax=Streptomyces viridochromogenes TaxID=1938 RepID=A0A0L8LF33_STRVR|nr:MULTISPECIES: hypothetical protein [Streptomyces]KOG36646.1 hypothetical protein ADK34_01600 [Streptomyces viridochromogenes]